MSVSAASSTTREKHHYPDERGRYGAFGGRFVPETLFYALDQLEDAYTTARDDDAFQRQLRYLQNTYVGRPTPLYFAERLTRLWGGAKVYLKREDLAHTGAHKINNALGQCLLTQRMGKRRVIAETGAGQHGVATATACALLGLEGHVYMGEEDMKRQELNVFRMRLMGCEVIPVTSGSRTLKDAINEAMRDWVTNVEDTHYVLGTVHGPHPFPMICRDFQSIIGAETRCQLAEREEGLPDMMIACVGGGSNAIGLFFDFIGDPDVRMVGVEAGGTKITPGMHAARFSGGTPGMLHGAISYVLQDEHGQIGHTHSVSAGLDYASVGPEHAYLHDTGRVEYVYASDEDALEGFKLCSQMEGIIPALETAHAIAYAAQMVPAMRPAQTVVINLSGRGDKDVQQAMRFIHPETQT